MFLHGGRVDADRRRSYTGLLPPCKEFGALLEEAETEDGLEDGTAAGNCADSSQGWGGGSGGYGGAHGHYGVLGPRDPEEVVHSAALEQAIDDLRRGSIDEEVMSLTLLVPQKLVRITELLSCPIICKVLVVHCALCSCKLIPQEQRT